MLEKLTVIILILLLMGVGLTTALTCSFRKLPQRLEEKTLQRLKGRFFYRLIHHRFFGDTSGASLLVAAVTTQMLLRFITAALAMFYVLEVDFFTFSSSLLSNALEISIATLIFLFFGDLLPRTLADRHPKSAMRLCAPLASPYMVMALPLTFLHIRLSKRLGNAAKPHDFGEADETVREQLFNALQGTDVIQKMEPEDKKLIESILSFRERIVREVMVPRGDVFALDALTSLREAARLLQPEGFSRVPVFSGTLDNIIGILMHKDLLSRYSEAVESNNIALLNAPIAAHVKAPLFAPETKRISHMLQEFRAKQVHLAVIVDEYGGTEGIATIEDILEELVGDIADEHDQTEIQYRKTDNGWLVEGAMPILDIEETMHISIPQDGEYDTIGGYIFHRAGMVPAAGFVIMHDDFEIEVLRTSDRTIEQVRLTATPLNSADG